MAGTFEIIEEDKIKMLGQNWASAHGFNIDEIKKDLPKDEKRTQDHLAAPYSTTDFEVIVP